MAVVFPREGNKLWPLPADYDSLTEEGQRMARVNACGLGGRPELEVARWHFFRETYLMPRAYSWYGRPPTPSPPAHYQWLYNWYCHLLGIHISPRGSCKTTINLEDQLSSAVGKPYWSCTAFLATQQFCSDRLGRIMDQIENNDLIVRDFGNLKPHRGSGQWNRGSQLDLRNGSKIAAKPIMGASAGTRPTGLLVLDDVEDPKDLQVNPADLRENFERFFYHGLYPMSQSPGWSTPIRIIGTLWRRTFFIYHLYTTDDPRVAENFHRCLMTVPDMNWDVWDEKWQEETRATIGEAAWQSQYMNNPGSEGDRLLPIHEDLTSYKFDGQDDAALLRPFASNAAVTSHVVVGYAPRKEGQENPEPITQRRVWPWSETVGRMRRFIMVDYARTTTRLSDYSAVHVMGFSNDEEHRDTLWSLDAWVGKVTREVLIKKVYELAVRWQVYMVGIEAYPVLSTFYEMAENSLPEMFQREGAPCPRVVAVKFPTNLEKADKIMGMEWRFRQFRVKLPSDRQGNPAYVQLWDQVRNFTEDMGLLDHDDMIDTLAMHQFVGKQRKSAAPDVMKPIDLVEELRRGNTVVDGVPVASGLNASEIPDYVLDELMDRRYEEAVGRVPEAAEYLKDDPEARQWLTAHGVPIWTP